MIYIGHIALSILCLVPGSSPKPSLLLAPDECPTATIRCAEGEQCKGKRRKLSVTISGADPAREPTYRWCVTGGAIVGGQGTYEVEVDASGVSEEAVTVVVVVGGQHRHCPVVAHYQMVLSE